MGRLRDPNVIVPFLLDSLEAGRLEVDYVNFNGPAFPEGCWDARLLALRMVQFKIARSVLLEKDAEMGVYKQVVPNTALYKRPVVVQRSRFQPVTKSHVELEEATCRQLLKEGSVSDRQPAKLFNLQIDDLARPIEGLHDTSRKLHRIRELSTCDLDEDGYLTKQELLNYYEAHHKGPLAKEDFEDIERLWELLDVKKTDQVMLEDIVGMSSKSVIDSEYLCRVAMIEALGYPIMVSGIRMTWQLAQYLKRYTNQKVAIVAGGPGYDMNKGLFREGDYDGLEGGIMQALGVLFKSQVNIYQYPNIDDDGTVRPLVAPEGGSEHLWRYLVSKQWLREIDDECIGTEVMSKDTNEPFRARTDKIISLMRDKDDAWEHYVPEAVLNEVKRNRQDWYTALGEHRNAKNFLTRIYQIFDGEHN